MQLSKVNCHRALQQSCLLEDILYKCADTMAEYQNLLTLEERVYKAGRAVYVSVRQLEMESDSEQRLAAAVIGDGAYRAMEGGVVQRRAVRLPQESWWARCMSFWNDLWRDRGRIISIIRHRRHLSTCTFQVP